MVNFHGRTVWLSALIAAVLFIGFDASLKLKSLETVAPSSSAPRRQIFESDDAYHWVMQTQQMFAEHTWRVRAVRYDNAPAGREVHWSSPPRWWLGFVASIHAICTGLPRSVAIEHAALYANTLLLAIFLLWVTPWTARNFGAWPAAWIALGLVTIVPIAAEFSAGSFDHHGIAAACALVTALGLLAAWKTPADANRHVTTSAIAGGIGLWINAASQIPLLVAIGAGALTAMTMAARKSTSLEMPAANGWRRWGLIGGAVSLVAYLVEYFPTHLGLRLEVNHPLYAFAWIAAGDWLARIQQRLQSGAWFTSPRERGIAIAGVVALGLPVAIILIWPAQAFVIRDAFLWRLHADYIAEFGSPLAHLQGGASNVVRALFVRLNVLPLTGIVGTAWLLLSNKTSPRHRMLIGMSASAALLVTVMALSQERWLSLANTLWLATVAVGIDAVLSPNFSKTQRRVCGVMLGCLVMLPYPLLLAARVPAIFAGAIKASAANRQQLALRDAASWLKRHAGRDHATVLSGPAATNGLIYFGELNGLGTLYWENHAGLRTTVDALGGDSAEATFSLLKAHGVTHLAVFSWASFANEAARLKQDLPASTVAPTSAFLKQLLANPAAAPRWSRPLFYRLPPDLAGSPQDFVLIFEFLPEQSVEEATVRQAQFVAAHGSPETAVALLKETRLRRPDYAPALIALAQLQVQARDVADLATTLPRLRAALVAAPDLAAEDRILAALVLAATRQSTDARTEIAKAWVKLDASTLQRLAPGTLRLLLRLTNDLHVEVPSELLRLANDLQSADVTTVSP